MVAGGHAESLINDVEVVNIDTYRIHLLVRLILIPLLAVAVEILCREQARKIIRCRRAYDLTVLRKLDQTAEP